MNYLLWGWPPDVVAPISPLLIELTQQDDKKKVNLIATWILCQNKLCNEDQIQKILNRLKGWYPDNQDEIEEIEDYLKEESSQAESDDFTEWD